MKKKQNIVNVCSFIINLYFTIFSCLSFYFFHNFSESLVQEILKEELFGLARMKQTLEDSKHSDLFNLSELHLLNPQQYNLFLTSQKAIICSAKFKSWIKALSKNNQNSVLVIRIENTNAFAHLGNLVIQQNFQAETISQRKLKWIKIFFLTNKDWLKKTTQSQSQIYNWTGNNSDFLRVVFVDIFPSESSPKGPNFSQHGLLCICLSLWSKGLLSQIRIGTITAKNCFSVLYFSLLPWRFSLKGLLLKPWQSLFWRIRSMLIIQISHSVLGWINVSRVLGWIK